MVGLDIHPTGHFSKIFYLFYPLFFIIFLLIMVTVTLIQPKSGSIDFLFIIVTVSFILHVFFTYDVWSMTNILF
jgi:hypothetical protein